MFSTFNPDIKGELTRENKEQTTTNSKFGLTGECVKQWTSVIQAVVVLQNLHSAKPHKHLKSHYEQSYSDRQTGNKLSVTDSKIALN